MTTRPEKDSIPVLFFDPAEGKEAPDLQAVLGAPAASPVKQVAFIRLEDYHKALESLKEEVKQTIRETVGESVHTAFRKGADSEEAWEIWKLIREMEDWPSAVGWMEYCFDVYINRVFLQVEPYQ